MGRGNWEKGVKIYGWSILQEVGQMECTVDAEIAEIVVLYVTVCFAGSTNIDRMDDLLVEVAR